VERVSRSWRRLAQALHLPASRLRCTTIPTQSINFGTEGFAHLQHEPLLQAAVAAMPPAGPVGIELSGTWHPPEALLRPALEALLPRAHRWVSTGPLASESQEVGGLSVSCRDQLLKRQNATHSPTGSAWQGAHSDRNS